jgi:hypothetical protein
MPFAAITYRVKPGNEDKIAEIFAGFQRVERPDFTDTDGNAAGKLLGTAVFIKDDVMVRVIHYEGDFAWVGRHMSQQQGVHLIEDALAPYLAYDRETTSEAGFGAYFKDATMRCISQLSLDTLPARG